MKVEFVALSSTVQKIVWLRYFLIHLGVHNNASESIIFNYDDKASKSYTKKSNFYENAKNIDIKYDFVRDIVVQKKVNMKFISTHQMIAYPLTNPISSDVLQYM